MRKSLIAAAALSAATPAIAQPTDDRDAEAAIESVDFDRAARVLESLVGAVMEIPVGGIAAAVDPLGRGGVYPNDTVGSLVRRGDPEAEQRVRAQIRGAARSAESASVAVARMMPVLQQSLEQMRAGLAEAIATARE